MFVIVQATSCYDLGLMNQTDSRFSTSSRQPNVLQMYERLNVRYNKMNVSE